MGNNGALGSNSSLLFSKTTLAVTDGVDLVSESLSIERASAEYDGILGGRQQDGAINAHVTHVAPGGSFTYRPRYDEMNRLLELALGGGTGASITPWIPKASGDLESFTIQVSKTDAYVEEYTTARIQSLVLTSEQQGPLTAEVTVIAADGAEEGSPVAPTYANIQGIVPIQHQDLVVTGTIPSASGDEPFRWQLTINNNLTEDGYANSANRQVMEPGEVECTLELDLAFSATLEAAVTTLYASKAVTTITSTFTSSDGSGDEVEFVFQGKVTSLPPQIGSREAQRWTVTLEGKATYSGGSITNNMIEVETTAGS